VVKTEIKKKKKVESSLPPKVKNEGEQEIRK
jgi:hypothetical protein